MLTIITKAAIAVLHDIHYGNCLRLAKIPLTVDEFDYLFHKLEAAGFIRLSPDKVVTTSPDAGYEESLRYELSRPLSELSLLDVLQALGESINCNQPTPESYYHHYGLVAQKIGVLNYMTRRFLSEIKMSDW